MNIGHPRFAQIMDFSPWKMLARYAERYGDNRRVCSLPCTGQFRIMAAQLTYLGGSARHRGLPHSASWQTSITWTYLIWCDAPRWPMPTSPAIGESTPTSHSSESPRLQSFMSKKIRGGNCQTPSMRWTQQRSTYVPWAHFHSTKAAKRMHTPLDLLGDFYPAF